MIAMDAPPRAVGVSLSVKTCPTASSEIAAGSEITVRTVEITSNFFMAFVSWRAGFSHKEHKDHREDF